MLVLYENNPKAPEKPEILISVPTAGGRFKCLVNTIMQLAFKQVNGGGRTWENKNCDCENLSQAPQNDHKIS